MREVLATVRNLRLNYGTVQALKNVSFEVYSGEILAVIGPNGSGKTSAIECLEGLRKPSGGSVALLGYEPCKNRKKIYTQVGIQLQEAEYPEKIKVAELCRLFSAFYREAADWRLLLKRFGLWEKASRPVKKLSGGEKQRLSILLALLPKPRLLILDELTTGLDPEVRRDIWESLKQICKAGTSILLISHYLYEVEYLADRLLYMESGVSAFVGTQTEFKSYVKDKAAPGKWRDGLTLEEIYLLACPQTESLKWEEMI